MFHLLVAPLPPTIFDPEILFLYLCMGLQVYFLCFCMGKLDLCGNNQDKLRTQNGCMGKLTIFGAPTPTGNEGPGGGRGGKGGE